MRDFNNPVYTGIKELALAFSFFKEVSLIVPKVQLIVSCVAPYHSHGVHLAIYKEFHEGKEAIQLQTTVETVPQLPKDEWIYVNWHMLLKSSGLLTLELCHYITRKSFSLLRKKDPPRIEK